MSIHMQVPAIVGGTVLIIEDIRSQNYVANVSGWAIFADGSAEFLDITIRGTYKSAETGKRIEINGVDTPHGIGFYSGSGLEQFPATIQPNFVGQEATLEFQSQILDGGSAGGQLVLGTSTIAGGDTSRADMAAESVTITGTSEMQLGPIGTDNAHILIDNTTASGVLQSEATTHKFYDGQLSDVGLTIDGEVISVEGETWHTVTFAGNWAVSGGFTCQYYRDATGRVQLRGRCLEAVAASATIFTLPVGYRPSQSMAWAVKSNNDGGTVSWLAVATTGVVSILGNIAQARVQTILDTVSFPTF